MIELVNAIIKYVVAPMEVGPEFALNLRLVWSDCGFVYFGKFEILN